MKSVFVVNNPSSLLGLFSALCAGIDEIWLEKGATPELDGMLDRAVEVLRLRQDHRIKSFEVSTLFSAAKHGGLAKILAFHACAKEVRAICKAEGVGRLVCSSTSAFRLADVPEIMVFDHGAGDYLRSLAMTRLERVKYAYLYGPPTRTKISYSAFVPLPGRSHVALDLHRMRQAISHLAIPFQRDRVSVLCLLFSLVPVEEQLGRVHRAMQGQPFDLYLKSHHFFKSAAHAADPKLLSEDLAAIPAEILVLGSDHNVRLAAFESSALWNVGVIDPARLVPISSRGEILALQGPWLAGTARLERHLNFSPYSADGLLPLPLAKPK